MLKNTYLKSILILILLLAFSFTDLSATDLSVDIVDVEVPESIWENKPITATCKYRILTNTEDHIFYDKKNSNFLIDKMNVEISFYGSWKKPETGYYSKAINHNADYNPERIDLREVITLDLNAGRLKNELLKGKVKGKLFPKRPGNYRLSCDIKSTQFRDQLRLTKIEEIESNSDNNSDELEVHVRGEEPLKLHEIPTLNITKPIGNKIEVTNLTPFVTIESKFTEDFKNQINHQFYTPDSSIVFEEKWNFRILRKNRDQFKQVAIFAELIKKSDKGIFTAKIPKETLNTLENGEYRIESWLNQDKTPYGNVVGEKTYKDFILSKTYIDIEKANEKDTNNLESTNKTVNKINTSKGKGFVRPEKTGVSKTPAAQQNPPSKFRRPESATNKPINNSVNALIKNTDLLYWTNLWGMDYKNFYADEWKVCKDACDNENSCKSWTWLKKGVTGPHARCFLKNGVPEKKSDQCCISGIK